jgi:hypothetical protein
MQLKEERQLGLAIGSQGHGLHFWGLAGGAVQLEVIRYSVTRLPEFWFDIFSLLILSVRCSTTDLFRHSTAFGQQQWHTYDPPELPPPECVDSSSDSSLMTLFSRLTESITLT